MLRKWIICGLGNPGRKYAGTRHNMGFLLLDYLTDRYSLSWRSGAGDYLLGESKEDDHHLVFLKPHTYMNLSGRALRDYSRRDRFEAHELLVLCDDFAIPLGRIRLRKKGSDGGHNGLRSIIELLSSQEFARLRMGVGPVPEGMDPADFVLGSFGKSERPLVGSAIRRAADCLDALIRGGFDEAMGRYNAPPPDGETD
ncbi:MAG: aminoacyl-tRNA hydrolase [Candidatus Latescibacterota bacterium]